jgi:centromere protein J
MMREVDSLYVDSSSYDPTRYATMRSSRDGVSSSQSLHTAFEDREQSSHQSTHSIQSRQSREREEDGSGLAYQSADVESWARSSRSSRGSRYSNEDDGEEDDGEDVAMTTEPDVQAEEEDEDQDYQGDSFRLPQTNFEMTFNSQGQLQRTPLDANRLFAMPTNDGHKAEVNPNPHASQNNGLRISADQFLQNNTIPAPAPASASGAPSREEEILADGTRIIRYRNGTIKEIKPTGRTIVTFLNGDSKTTTEQGEVIYYYNEAQTYHTTHSDGLEVYEFPNKQVEKHYKNGLKEISFPDKTTKTIHSDGTTESKFPDGMLVREFVDGRRQVFDAQGQLLST